MNTSELLLYLVRLAIGTNCIDCSSSFSETDWKEIEALAFRQGLSAVIVDGVEQLPDSYRPSKEVLLQWIGNTLQGYEYRYDLYCRTIADMASWYNSHSYKMMVLKGYACGMNWPKPEHRPCGDIDIWLFGEQKEADKALLIDKGIKIDNSRQHHTVFYWRDFMVENHYDFIDVHFRRTSPKFEKVLKELGKDDSHYVEIKDASTGSATKVYLPSPNLHALFLIRHMIEHFASSEITIRQLLDWAFFIKKNRFEINWTWLEKTLNEFGMMPAYTIFNAICVEDLGFESVIFPRFVCPKELKDRVLVNIFYPECQGVAPRHLIPRIIFKYKRWKSNGWKNKLCFKESLWSAFWCGVWGHIVKPSSI